jgi:hypothetical protein
MAMRDVLHEIAADQIQPDRNKLAKQVSIND